MNKKIDLGKYILISFISFLALNKVWMMWEEIKYGEIRPDNFDGLMLYLISFLITYVLYQREVISNLKSNDLTIKTVISVEKEGECNEE